MMLLMLMMMMLMMVMIVYGVDCVDGVDGVDGVSIDNVDDVDGVNSMKVVVLMVLHTRIGALPTPPTNTNLTILPYTQPLHLIETRYKPHDQPQIPSINHVPANKYNHEGRGAWATPLSTLVYICWWGSEAL